MRAGSSRIKNGQWILLNVPYYESLPVILFLIFQTLSVASLANFIYVSFPVSRLNVPNSRINEVADATVVSVLSDVCTVPPSSRTLGLGIPVVVLKAGSSLLPKFSASDNNF